MKRIKLDDRKLPTYTKGEEIFNMTSHICRSSARNSSFSSMYYIFSNTWQSIWSSCKFHFWFNHDFAIYNVKYISWIKTRFKSKKSISSIRSLFYISTYCRFIYSICTLHPKRSRYSSADGGYSESFGELQF